MAPTLTGLCGRGACPARAGRRGAPGVQQMLALILCGAAAAAAPERYEPNWTSLMTRPLPVWYDQAKVGIFIHWGVYSVPSFNIHNISKAIKDGYAGEWYWWYLHGLPTPEVIAFHQKNYGPNFTYQEFAPMFKAELWDPQQWAQLFKDSGAQYVVLTAKHHEGWCNWCSPEAFGWNACDNGPHRDLVGEMTKAVRAQGLHMGLYHSIFEWYHPLYLEDKANGMRTSRYVDEVYLPQAKELNTRYSPDLIWSDGDWDANSSYWKSPEFLAWLYNEAPNRDTVIVNDRWGNDNPKIGSGKHFGGYFSGGDRQQANPTMLKHKWENAFTIDAATWGYARDDPYSAYLNISTLLYEIISTVSYGGNVLINVGPTADGRIATIFQERLKQMGNWLKVNGEAIFHTKMWREHNDTASHGVGHGVYYTASRTSTPEVNGNANRNLSSDAQGTSSADTGNEASVVYAIAMEWPTGNELMLRTPRPSAGTSVEMLGVKKPISWRPAGQPTTNGQSMEPTQRSGMTGLILELPPLSPPELPTTIGPWVFKLISVI